MVSLLKKFSKNKTENSEKTESKRKNKKLLKLKQRSGTMYAPKTGYTSTASIIRSGNRYGTVFKVVNSYGMNRNQKLGWAVKMIPHVNVEGVKGYLVTESKPFSQKEQSHIFKNVVPETEKTYKVGDLGNVDSASDRRKRKARLQDFSDASVLDGDNNLALDLNIFVLIVSDNPDSIQTQVRKLGKTYGKEINGVKLMTVAGVQEEMFENLLLAVDGEESDYTIMSTLYAGFDHALRKGLNDKRGLPIGELSDSYTKGQAFMALNESFKSKTLVAAHRESWVLGYDTKLSASSLWGQLIANNAMMYGHKVYHLVLNGFRYYGDVAKSKFGCPPSLNKHIGYVDLSKGGLNPFQMFGDISNVHNIFNNNLEKLYQITYLASGRTLATAKNDLTEMLREFYIDAKVWHRDAEEHPERTKVVGITRPETVKTYGDFIRVLRRKMDAVREDPNSTEKEKDNAKELYQTVEGILNTYEHLFNRTTTLPVHKDDNKLQWYYDVSHIENPDIREAQFINAFDYCTYSASENDIVMIHGMDKLSVETLQLLQDNLDRLSEKGVRLSYLFDTIGSGETRQKVPRADVFNTDGILYQDFEQQFDYTILGTMSTRELASYEGKGRQNLNAELQNALIRDRPYQYQIRRTIDLTSNIIAPANFMI